MASQSAYYANQPRNTGEAATTFRLNSGVLASSLLTNATTNTQAPATTDSPPVSPAVAPDEAVTTEPNARKTRLATSNAAGWGLSLAFHLTAYSIAAILFAWLSIDLIRVRPPQPVTSIQASLDDETVLDDLPALEIVPTAGPETQESPQTLQQLASHLAVTDRGQLDTVVTDARIAIAGTAESDAGDAGDSPFFRIPEGGLAVTKGSFTAWTDPPQPLPNQFYQIIIEIRLPDKVSRYRLSDLSGEVIGTDGYHQRIPFDVRKPGAARVTGGADYETVRRNMTVKMTGSKLQLAVRVPGAKRLVMDRIRIKSRRLREEEELTLVFGHGNQPAGLGQNQE